MSQSRPSPASPSRALSLVGWSLQALLALVFLAAGGAKLAGAPMMVQVFDLIGFGQWFRVVTGLVEIVGAVALLVPGYAVFGALWLACTMAAALLAHLVVLPTSFAPAALLLVLCALAAWLRRNQLSGASSRLDRSAAAKASTGSGRTA